MRDKHQILDDALRATEKPIDHIRANAKLAILTLEAVVDIRDVLNERLLEIDRGIHALKDV